MSERTSQSSSGPLTLKESAPLIGGYRWVEQALFELLGSWVAETPLPAVQLHLDAQSARHAWHAELWSDRLPVLAGVDADAMTVAPESAAAVLAALAGNGLDGPEAGQSWGTSNDDALVGPVGVLPRLAGLYRVVIPRLVVSYTVHAEVASTITDGPTLRVLKLILADEIEDWHVGERMVQQLMSRPHDVAAVYSVQQRLESLVVGLSIGSGLVPFPRQ